MVQSLRIRHLVARTFKLAQSAAGPASWPAVRSVRPARAARDATPVRSKRPANVREATKRLVGPSGLACGGEDHETPCCLHAHPSDDHRLSLAPQQRDRIIDLRSSKEGLGGVQEFVTRVAISLSRTARSPPDDLIRYETSPVWSAGMRRVTS